MKVLNLCVSLSMHKCMSKTVPCSLLTLTFTNPENGKDYKTITPESWEYYL